MPGREEALERARTQLTGRKRSLSELQGQFAGDWFPGDKAFSEPVIRLHDSAHQWSNISPTPRGELQQTLVDVAGTQKLYEKTNARGAINSLPFGVAGFTAEDFDTSAVADAAEQLVEVSKGLDNPVRGLAVQSELPVNSPARLQFPPITHDEADELIKRGREFYGGVGEQFKQKARPSIIQSADPNRVTANQPFQGAEIPVNAQSQWIHERGDEIELKGGYDAPGRMSYGPIEARLNRPLQYTVDEGLLMKEASKSFRGELGSHMEMIKSRFPATPLESLQRTEAETRQQLGGRYGLPEMTDTFSSFLDDHEESFAEQDRLIQRKISDGANKEASALAYVMRDRTDDATAEVAARARDLTKTKNAVRVGSRAAAGLVPSLPIYDPGFRAAVEKGDTRKAGTAILADLAAGAVATPVVGAAAGVLQRAAPRVAARALPAVAAVSRVGNPVALTSQLGGSRQLTKPQERADQRAGEAQLRRAEAARKRGGRWGVSTPFGRLTVPELGLSEAGGLFFR